MAPSPQKCTVCPSEILLQNMGGHPRLERTFPSCIFSRFLGRSYWSGSKVYQPVGAGFVRYTCPARHPDFRVLWGEGIPQEVILGMDDCSDLLVVLIWKQPKRPLERRILIVIVRNGGIEIHWLEYILLTSLNRTPRFNPRIRTDSMRMT